MKAIWNGKTIAEGETVVVEGNHYFRKQDVDADALKPTKTHTVCGWKGTASYYTVVVDGKENTDAAWYYPDPKPEAANIQDRVAFWKGVQVR